MGKKKEGWLQAAELKQQAPAAEEEKPAAAPAAEVAAPTGGGAAPVAPPAIASPVGTGVKDASKTPPAAAAGAAPDDGACHTGDCKEKVQKAKEAAAAHPEARRLKVAVYTLKTEGELNPRIAVLVTDSLVAEVRKLERVSTISMAEIQDMLTHAEQKRMLGCEADECLMEIGGALGVDLIVTGNIGVMGDSHLFNLRAIDVNGMKVQGRVSRRLKGGNGEEFLEAIGPAIEALFPDHPVREGFVRGVASEEARKLNPPPLPTVWFWSTAGAAAACAIAGGAFALSSRSTKDDWNTLADQSRKEPVDASRLQTIQDRMDSQTLWANGLFIGAGALGLAAGVEALFTDWRGDRQSRISLRPVATLLPGGGGLGGLVFAW